MQSRDRVLHFHYVKVKGMVEGGIKGERAARPETAPSRGPGAARASKLASHPSPSLSQGRLVPTLRAPLLPIYFSFKETS